MFRLSEERSVGIHSFQSQMNKEIRLVPVDEEKMTFPLRCLSSEAEEKTYVFNQRSFFRFSAEQRPF